MLWGAEVRLPKAWELPSIRHVAIGRSGIVAVGRDGRLWHSFVSQRDGFQGKPPCVFRLIQIAPEFAFRHERDLFISSAVGPNQVTPLLLSRCLGYIGCGL